MKNPYEQSLALIHKAERICCITSNQSAISGYCSLLALTQLLQKLGKNVTAIHPGAAIEQLNFLPEKPETKTALSTGEFVISISTKKNDVEHVKYNIEDDHLDIIITPKNTIFRPEDVTFKNPIPEFDLVITLDVNELDELDDLYTDHLELFTETTVINISSEPANTEFGRLNLIDVTASSEIEILIKLIQDDSKLEAKLNPAIATTLLTGIISTTGNFLESNTSFKSLTQAAWLQQKGANQSEIIDHLYKQKRLKTLKLWGQILFKLQLDPIHRISWSSLDRADFENFEAGISDVEHIGQEVLRYINQADIAVLTMCPNGHTIIQIRTNDRGIDFKTLQKIFGGEIVTGGLDIRLDGKTLADVEKPLLQRLVQLQNERLGIDPSVPLTKYQIEKPQTIPTPAVTKPISATPAAPTSIPFDAPEQPHESTGKMPEKNPAESSLERGKIKEKNNEDLPDWIKKTFPQN